MNLSLSCYACTGGADTCSVGLIAHCYLKRSGRQSLENSSSQPRALNCMPLLVLAGPLLEISYSPSLDAIQKVFLQATTNWC